VESISLIFAFLDNTFKNGIIRSTVVKTKNKMLTSVLDCLRVLNDNFYKILYIKCIGN